MLLASIVLVSLCGQGDERELLTADNITDDQLRVIIAKRKEIKTLSYGMKNPEKEVRRRSRIMVRETAKDDWGMSVPSDEIDAIIDRADDEEQAAKRDGTIETHGRTDDFNGLKTYSLSFTPASGKDRSLLFVLVGGSSPIEEASITFYRTHHVTDQAFIGKNADIYANDEPVMRRETEPRPSKATERANLISSRNVMLTLDEFRAIISKDAVIRINVGDQSVTISKRDVKRIREWLAGVEEREKQGSE